MTQLTALRPKTYHYLTDDSDGNKKVKSTEKCVIKKKNLN